VAYPLLTERLTIEPLAHQDLKAFVRYRRDPEIARFQSWDTDYSELQGSSLIDSQVGILLPEPGEWLQLAIRESKYGKLLGDLALHRLADEGNSFEIGFTIAAEFQGKGFAREAAYRLIEFLFRDQNDETIVACTDRRNTSSVNLLISLGFKPQPAKSWVEFFKNEHVTVDQYEIKGLENG